MFKENTFSRNLFVSLHRIVCQSCVIGEKDGTNILIAQFSFELRPRKKKDEQNIITLKWALYAQTSTYVIMGCRRPEREYGDCLRFLYAHLVSADSPIEEIVLTK